MRTQRAEQAQPGYWAEYLPLWNQPIVERFQDASCSPACKAIATCAAAAWERGWTAAQWREDVRRRHPEEPELRLIAEAEQCMRTSGIWLWNDQVPGAA